MPDPGARPPERITLGHGSGGILTRDLVRDVFVAAFANPVLAKLGDSAILAPETGRLAMTTDGFVVRPLFFPGGDIGRLAVNGTVNDLAVSGAVPLYLTAAFILEEGLAGEDLARIAGSMADAARQAGVSIVTGDTKVVERGHGDGVFIVTAGVGRVREPAPEGAASVRPGDVVFVSGPVGDHGAVIGAVRSSLDVAGGLESDCASVAPVVAALADAGVRPRFLRDPTRGGLATVLAELAHEAGVTIELREEDVPVRDTVRAVCDILGLDPLYLACEGRVAGVVPADQADAALEAMRGCAGGAGAAIVGCVRDAGPGPVVLVTRYGGHRMYDTLASEPLPRIC